MFCKVLVAKSLDSLLTLFFWRLPFSGVNGLVGSLPEELSLLGALKTIKVAGNSLTGEIPTKLRTLANLHTVHLEANRFHGDLNHIFCERNNDFATFDSSSFATLTEVHSDCAAPHHRVTCDCCTGCSII